MIKHLEWVRPPFKSDQFNDNTMTQWTKTPCFDAHCQNSIACCLSACASVWVIVLPQVHNGQQISCALRKEDLGRPSKGTILLELEVLFNPVSAKHWPCRLWHEGDYGNVPVYPLNNLSIERENSHLPHNLSKYCTALVMLGQCLILRTVPVLN